MAKNGKIKLAQELAHMVKQIEIEIEIFN